MSAWQPCGRRLRECIDDVCRSMGACAWPPEAWTETPAGLDTGGKGAGAADSVSSEVTAAPVSAAGGPKQEEYGYDLDDDGYCIPGCPDDTCRMSGHCARPG